MKATNGEFSAVRENADENRRPLMLAHEGESSSQLESVHLAAHDSMSRRHGYTHHVSPGYLSSFELGQSQTNQSNTQSGASEPHPVTGSTSRKVKSNDDEKSSLLPMSEGGGGAHGANAKVSNGGSGKQSSGLLYGSAPGEGGEELSTNLKTFGNLFIAFVGAGILGLPYAFRRGGIVLTGLVIIIVAAASYWCMLLLVTAKRAHEEYGIHSFGDVARAAFGRVGEGITNCLLITSQTCFCVAYVIFIAENLTVLLSVNKITVAVILLPLEIVLSWIRSLTSLAPFSLFADFVNMMAVFIIFWDDVEMFHKEHLYSGRSVTMLPFLFGVSIYCYEGIGMILPIEASMKKREHFEGILALAMTVITTLFMMFGLVGYVAYGKGTKDIVTLNLPIHWSTSLVQLSLCAGLFFTFPVMMIPVYEIIEKHLASQDWFESFASTEQFKYFTFNLIRTTLVTLTGIVAIKVPGFGLFISLIGSGVCAILAFVMPTLFHLKLCRPQGFAFIADIGMLAFGIVGAVLGTMDSLMTIIGSEA